ncbi:MAG: arginine deiminase-related protein [Acidimicrobiales bacterium]
MEQRHGLEQIQGAELSWGRRLLMCPPDEFGIEYSINPWMNVDHGVDVVRAHRQWQTLRDTLIAAGATVEVLPAQPGVPDLVFTANAGLVDGDRFAVATFRHEQRQPERIATAQWFGDHGFDVEALPAPLVQEGAGDALPFRDRLVAGYAQRSGRTAYDYLARVNDLAIQPVRLVDPRLYHLDIVFCPLDDRSALVVPSGMASDDARALIAAIPDPIIVEHSDALHFVANSVVVGRAVVMPHVPREIGHALEARGFSVVECPMSEFQKAGGACRCLTLALDVDLPRRSRVAMRRASGRIA